MGRAERWVEGRRCLRCASLRRRRGVPAQHDEVLLLHRLHPRQSAAQLSVVLPRAEQEAEVVESVFTSSSPSPSEGGEVDNGIGADVTGAE